MISVLVVLLAAAAPAPCDRQLPIAARLSPRPHQSRTLQPKPDVSRRARCSLSMLVDSVESTPNPSAFLLRLDGAPEGVATDGLRGQSFRGGAKLVCPPGLAAALATEGVESIFACGDMLTVSKAPAAQWDALLPTVIAALGGGSERLAASGLQPVDGGQAAPPSSGGVAVRLQAS